MTISHLAWASLPTLPRVRFTLLTVLPTCSLLDISKLISQLTPTPLLGNPVLGNGVIFLRYSSQI